MDLLGAFAVLNPQGSVALAERGLILHAVWLMLIVLVPVLALTFFFAWRYRAGNTKARYVPNWEHGKMEELVWWIIPFEIVLILGALTWSSTHELDPRAPLDGGAPLIIQVVALDWKWLFLYPEQKIAAMNSFWIPQLGGQIYAMTGMVNVLNLVADRAGTFKGLSANYSGAGFAHMKFMVIAAPQENFDAWVQSVKESPGVLNQDTYLVLTTSSVAHEVVYYGQVEPNLYADIVAAFGYSGAKAAVPAH